MKRVIALACLICCLWSSSMYSADIDLSGYSIDELLELRKLITEELSNKGYSEKLEFPNGEYECGVDIKPGRYLFSVEGEKVFGRVIRYDSKEDSDNDVNDHTQYFDEGDSKYIEFKEGDYIVVLFTDGILYIEDGTKTDAFWAP